MQKYDLFKIGQRIFEEQQKVYVRKNSSKQYYRDADCRIVYSHSPMDGYKQATQKDILNIAAELGYHFGRNTLSDIQNGKKQPKDLSLEELTALCTIYDCEIGYLLCEQEQPHKATEDIMKATSLSANAVNGLLNIKAEDKEGDVLPMLNFCLSDGKGCYISFLMKHLHDFIENITLDGTIRVTENAKTQAYLYDAFICLRDDFIASDATIQKKLKKKRKEQKEQQKEQQLIDNLLKAEKKHLTP